MLSSCMNEEDYFTKTDVETLLAEQEARLAKEAAEHKTAIDTLQAAYTEKITILEKEDRDLKTAIETLTATYNAKVAELEAADSIKLYYKALGRDIVSEVKQSPLWSGLQTGATEYTKKVVECYAGW